jgi:hypothetical protein
MSEMSISVTAREELVLSLLRDLGDGQVEDAIGHFADEFRFKDHGIGLEFKDKQRLAEFFRKTRELYPEFELRADTILLSGDHVIMEWTLQTILMEPFYGGLKLRVPVSLHGVSIVRTENGTITDWAEYYHGLTARRTELASYFTEWIEL